MRILHVGFGFRPWIVNGLVIYSEAVMEGQVRAGHSVGYFFPARQLPLLRRPFLHRWRRGGVQMYEWVNSTLVVGRHRGTADPEGELGEPHAEATFRRVLNEFRPDLVHIHDLGGLPSSLLEVTRSAGVATVMTIHDYHPLCPTVKLYDAYDQICLRTDPGEMCAVCCAGAPRDNTVERAFTLWYARQQIRARIPRLDSVLRSGWGRHVSRAGAGLMDQIGASAGAPGPEARIRSPQAPAAAYQRRRDVNLERLNGLDALIASSERSAEIYRELGVDQAPIVHAPVNPPHIERLRPRNPGAPEAPLRFAALNAGSSTQKGADLLAETVSELSRRGLDDRYRLLVFGAVAPHVEPALLAHPSVELRGHYRTEELDGLLAEVDVGLVPSVWEEVYGFAALEFLAKGIPVIGNAVGALPEHVRPDETGWLNRSSSAAELAELMATAIEHPGEVQRLSRSVLARREELIEPFEVGLERLMKAYTRVLAPAGRG